jgi:hypothetical protein
MTATPETIRCYKLVAGPSPPWNSLTLPAGDALCVSYRLGEWSSARIPNTPLMAFETEADALKFVASCWRKRRTLWLLEGEGEPFDPLAQPAVMPIDVLWGASEFDVADFWWRLFVEKKLPEEGSWAEPPNGTLFLWRFRPERPIARFFDGEPVVIPS